MFRSLSRTGIRPIEIGRKLIRAIDAGRTTGADGRTTAPNVFSVHLNENDRSTFGDLEKPLITELIDAAKQYVADEGFSLVGEVTVALVTDASIKAGKCEVQATVSATSGLSEAASASPHSVQRSAEAPPTAGQTAPAVPTSPSPAPAAAVTPPTVATPSIPPVPAPVAPAAEKKAVLVMGDGTKVAVKPGVMSIGRSAESSLPLNDTNASRKHAEIRSRGDGAKTEWYVADLGSTNGTMLNGVKISGEQKLRHGDALMFGSTPARFEVA
ncbi:MAG: DUF2662 domain-containing protein [Ilumatobacteraceae bacterium]|nr:DUF2662 domain-containing protein [Ilumatobacteraceae bacterium]